MFITDKVEFESSVDQFRQATVIATVGSATLQAKAGPREDINAAFADVDGGAVTDTDGNFTFYAPQGQLFHFLITGDAVVWLSG